MNARHLFMVTFLVAMVGLISSLAAQMRGGPCPFGRCTNRLVTMNTNAGNGSLRAVLAAACRDDGDDRLDFTFRGTIRLTSPIDIPAACRGRIALYGRTDGKDIIDGSRMGGPTSGPWEHCLIRLSSNGNIIENLYFVGLTTENPESKPGIGLCIFGEDNQIQGNGFGIIPEETTNAGNDIGLFIYGRDNNIRNNQISHNHLDGLVISGYSNFIHANIIGEQNPLCSQEDEPEVPSPTVSQPLTGTGTFLTPSGPIPTSPSIQNKSEPSSTTISGTAGKRDPVPQPGPGEKPGWAVAKFKFGTADTNCTAWGNGRDGIRLIGGAAYNLIGYPHLTETGENTANRIEFNGGNGISQIGVSTSTQNMYSRNIISRNGGIGIDLTSIATDVEITSALASNGVTPNDTDDADEGPNTLLNYPDRFRAHVREYFSRGEPARRYRLYGSAPLQSTLELYLTHGLREGVDDRQGWHFLQETAVDDYPLFVADLDPGILLGSQLTLTAHRGEAGTSEFSEGILLDKDADLDGIPDFVEDRNENGFVDGDETDPFNPDTDGDGLIDSMEDRNRNGRWDEATGETKGYAADSDGDLVNDYVETRGDGIYEPENRDTDPLAADTDGDCWKDGTEDRNRNGIWEGHQGEGDPSTRAMREGPGCEP